MENKSKVRKKKENYRGNNENQCKTSKSEENEGKPMGNKGKKGK